MDDRPNILFFIADGMQGAAVDPGSQCHAPNLRELSRRGVQFMRAHTVLPTCSPARASIMTGQLPHNHGVLQVEHCVDEDQSVLREGREHWAQVLQRNGYHTGYFGKWHVERSNELERFGWDVNGCDAVSSYRQLGGGKGATGRLIEEAEFLRYQRGPDGYRDVLHHGVTRVPTEERSFAHVANNAAGFVEQAARMEAPWACCVGFSEPNVPLVAGKETFDRYDVSAMQLPRNLHDPMDDKPALYRRVQDVYRHTTAEEWREIRACYFALITELDTQVGRLLGTLRETGQEERTLVVFLSDHARYLGAHGMDAHNFAAFEEAYRVPLIVAGPGVAHGATTSALVSNADLYPTILEYCGCSQWNQVSDSRSFLEVLNAPEDTTVLARYDTGYAEYHGTRFPLAQRVLWHGKWKYVFNGFDYDELYDLHADPHELRNLARLSEYRSVARQLMGMIWHRVRETGDRALEETHYSPMRFAVVGPEADTANH
jgi:arylsulfatase A-like enzyme